MDLLVKDIDKSKCTAVISGSAVVISYTTSPFVRLQETMAGYRKNSKQHLLAVSLKADRTMTAQTGS